MENTNGWEFVIVEKNKPLDIKHVQIGKNYKVQMGRLVIEMTGFEIKQYAYELDQLRNRLLFLFDPIRNLEDA